MEIKTDHKWRQFKHVYDVTRDEAFIMYKGTRYDLNDFMKTESTLRLLGWHGIHTDTFFSGIVVRISDDGEEYMIGTIYT